MSANASVHFRMCEEEKDVPEGGNGSEGGIVQPVASSKKQINLPFAFRMWALN
jgi:hypothetical protein